MEISEFLPEVYVEAPGVPEVAALFALRNALRAFCDKSELWVEDLDPVTPLQDAADYDLDPPLGAEISHAMSARYGSRILPIVSEQELTEAYEGWRSVTGTSVTAVIVEPRRLRVFPIPIADDATTVIIRAALRPRMNATRCDDKLARWNEALVAGALARLKAMRGKPWEDREAVAAYDARFRQGAAQARAAVIRGNAFGSVTAKPRRFGF